jgi:hypothetical protein
MRGHLLVGGVQVRLVATRLQDSCLGVVWDDQLRAAAHGADGRGELRERRRASARRFVPRYDAPQGEHRRNTGPLPERPLGTGADGTCFFEGRLPLDAKALLPSRQSRRHEREGSARIDAFPDTAAIGNGIWSKKHSSFNLNIEPAEMLALFCDRQSRGLT